MTSSISGYVLITLCMTTSGQVNSVMPVEELRTLLRDNPQIVRDRYTSGSLTLLMIASRSGASEVVAVLLRAGSDPNATSRDGETALMLAAGSRRPDVVRMLLAAGAEVGRQDGLGRTALHHALDGERASGQLHTTVKALMDAGADVLLRDRQNRLPIDAARRRRWSLRVPFVGWRIGGWRRVYRDAVTEMLDATGQQKTG